MTLEWTDNFSAEVMLVKKSLLVKSYLYVGEDRNVNVCWWSMLEKTFLYVGEKYCMLVKILKRNLNKCWWSMLVNTFLYVGEKYVLEKILVFTNIRVFRQHPSPT